MEEQLIKHIKAIKVELGKILVEIDPGNDVEWDTHDKITAAHKQLRSIDYGKLGQLKLPEPEAPKVECPMCHGEREVNELNGETTVRTACPRCLGAGKIPAQISLEAAPSNTVGIEPTGERTPEKKRRGRPTKEV